MGFSGFGVLGFRLQFASTPNFIFCFIKINFSDKLYVDTKIIKKEKKIKLLCFLDFFNTY
jgi:hypothetical protein